MSNNKTVKNLFYSFKRYMAANFIGMDIFYNPQARPSNLVAEKYLMVQFQDEFLGKISLSFPRIICVVKRDLTGDKVFEFASTVAEKFTSPGSGKRVLDFYDSATERVIGHILVDEQPKVRPTLPYSEGYVQKAIDLILKYEVESRHL